MKRNLLFILAFLFLVLFNLRAGHIEQEKALENAKTFFSQRNVLLKKATTGSVRDSFVVVKLNSNVDKLRSASTSSSVPAFYIFNRVSGGFVIVAAEDCVKSILGYSDEGSFVVDNMPENISSWLNFYTNEIQYAASLESASTTSTISSTASSVVVSPLLKNIKWNQEAPYNDSCPSISGTKTVTGCVATAMAQIMKYYNWPAIGTGSHKFYSTTVKDTLSANFGVTSYEWSNMLASYSSTYTTTQAAAIAQLMYHCGVAVDMSYNTEAIGSGASIYDAGAAFYTYFGYDSDIQAISKDLYSYSDWKTIIKNELDNTRPVLYTGQSSDGGHAFVCDGYDSDDLFHINWGWSGMSDGYFELSALNSDVQGVGGATGGFSSDQTALINIQKPDDVTNATYEIGMYSKTLTPSATIVSTTNTFSINYGFVNYGLNTFSGTVGLALYQNGSFIKILKSASISSLSTGYGYTTYSFTSLSLSGVAAGTYQIYAVYQPSGASDWSMIKKTVALNNYINVTISGTTATFSAASYQPTLVLTQTLVSTTNLYNSETCAFDVSVTNTGTAEFNSNVAVYIYNSAKTSTQYLGAGVVDVPVGDTVTFQLSGTISLAAGTYSAAFVYDSGNNGGTSYTTAGPSTYSPVSLTINATPTAIAVLSVSDVLLSKSSVAQYDTNSITATVTNTGGYFGSYIIAFLFNSAGGLSIGYIGPTTYYIDNGKSISLNLNGDIDLSVGSYLIALFYYDNGWSQLSSAKSFTVVSPTISVSSNSINIAAAANSMQNVAVTSNTTWTAKSDQSWLTVSPKNVYGNSSLTFTAEENTTGSSRTANVTVADNGSTSQTIVITQAAGSSSVINSKSNNLIITPNPATNYFSVVGITDNTDVVVTDISGKLILKQQISSDEKVNVSGWSKGMYLVKVNGKTIKLVVK